jgi:acetylornithine deacetylase/succinyl-diaminopimelate desuccinylase-like protein
LRQAERAAAVLGETVWRRFPWVDDRAAPAESPLELLLNNTWRPTLAVTGADGLPALVNAGNVLLPGTTLKLSFRLPPTCDAQVAAKAVKDALEKDPPPFARVGFRAESTMGGWNAPAIADWLDRSIRSASEAHFGKPSMYMGTGGSIPFMGMLGARFPEAQFLVTGLLGPNSNAHGPNEFLHIATGKRLTACVSHVLRDHFVR